MCIKYNVHVHVHVHVYMDIIYYNTCNNYRLSSWNGKQFINDG